MSAASKRPRQSEANNRQVSSKKPRAAVDHGALLAEALPALNSKAASCFNYLQTWSKQGTKGPDGVALKWKFEKNKQSWLIDNMYDDKMVEDAAFDLLEAYLAGLKGAQRARCLEIAKGLLEDHIAAPISARDAFLKRYKAASPENVAAAAKAAAAAAAAADGSAPAAAASADSSAATDADGNAETGADTATAPVVSVSDEELPPDTRPPLPEGFAAPPAKKTIKARAQRIAALLA